MIIIIINNNNIINHIILLLLLNKQVYRSITGRCLNLSIVLINCASTANTYIIICLSTETRESPVNLSY